MIFQIPTSTDPLVGDYDQRVQLDGVEYALRFQFNTRSGFWFVTISDADGNVLLAGRKCVRGAPLLGRRPRQAGLPPGVLLVIGLDDPTQDFLPLYYFDAAEVGVS